MKTYTIIVYVVPAGGHQVESLEAIDATDAVLRLRTRLDLAPAECEVVAVASGLLHFEPVDSAQIALAPYCAASPG